jgi:phenylacetate-CoA ligase
MANSQVKRLQTFVQHAYDHAPAVKTIFDQASVSPAEIQSIADLEKIPVTSKERLAELQSENPPFGGFLTVPLQDLKHIFLSPGPLYEPEAGERALTEVIKEVLTLAGFTDEDVVLIAFGYHLIPTGLALDKTVGEIGGTVIPAGVGNADLQVKMMAELGVSAYIGPPSWLMALIKKSEELGLSFGEEVQLQKVLVSAEPLPADMRQAFVEEYGLSVTNAYGTAELGFLAYDKEGNLAMRLLEGPVIQVVDPESGRAVDAGEVGEVVVTSFNETYPLIRLGTGDLAMNVDPEPGVSQQKDRSIILVGRVGEAIKVRGMFVHPNQLRFALGQIPGVAQAQAVVTRQEHRDEFTLRVVSGGEGAPETDGSALSEALTAAIRSVCRVKVDRIEFVPSEAFDAETPILIDERSWD